MITEEFISIATLMVVLLNPLLLAVYLAELIRELDFPTFVRVLLRAGVVAFVAFAVVALVGERLFRDVLQIRYASFVLFGGLVFLLVGVRMVFSGPEALQAMRGGPQHIAGSIAMPFLIGPGTVNASIIAGSRMSYGWALVAIAIGLAVSLGGVALAKVLLDRVRQRNEPLVERYMDVIGRIGALVIGSFAVDMLLNGYELWQAAR